MKMKKTLEYYKEAFNIIGVKLGNKYQLEDPIDKFKREKQIIEARKNAG